MVVIYIYIIVLYYMSPTSSSDRPPQNTNMHADTSANYFSFFNTFGASNNRTPTSNSNTNRSQQGFTRNINNSQMYLLEMYNAQYNDLMRQINERHQEANSIRQIMNAIISTSFPNMPTPNATPSSYEPIRANPLLYVDSLFTNTANNRRAQPRRSVGSQRRTRNIPENTPFANSLFSSFFDRVHVAPTSEQIRQSTRTILFRDIESPINERCPISFEVFRPNEEVLQILHCGHIFNPCEIAVWFESNVGCPVCRFDIRNHRQETVSDVDQTQAQPSYQYQNEFPSGPQIRRQNAYDERIEETKEDTASQETKEDSDTSQNQQNRTANTRPLSTTPLIDAIMYILSPISNERTNRELTSILRELENDGGTTNEPTISFDTSYNMYYMDYEFGPRT